MQLTVSSWIYSVRCASLIMVPPALCTRYDSKSRIEYVVMLGELHIYFRFGYFVAGSVRCLCYDPEKRVLFSGGFDKVVVVWDIGSQKGTAYELTGHE